MGKYFFRESLVKHLQRQSEQGIYRLYINWIQKQYRFIALSAIAVIVVAIGKLTRAGISQAPAPKNIIGLSVQVVLEIFHQVLMMTLILMMTKFQPDLQEPKQLVFELYENGEYLLEDYDFLPRCH